MLADKIHAHFRFRELFDHVVLLTAVAVIYVGLAKLSLALASIHPSATPIWPPTGYALAIILLSGYRVSPAVFLGAFIANLTTAGSIGTSFTIATGNVLESLVGAYLINRWSDGRSTFDTPVGVARFALICLFSTVISPTFGVGSLSFAGYADWPKFPSIWTTWWIGDLSGALVITPAIVLWSTTSSGRIELLQSCAVYAATVVVGLLAFSPLLEQSPTQSPLAFLAILPLMWAALRLNQRDTATTALLLSCFAVWGTTSKSWTICWRQPQRVVSSSAHVHYQRFSPKPGVECRRRSPTATRRAHPFRHDGAFAQVEKYTLCRTEHGTSGCSSD